MHRVVAMARQDHAALQHRLEPGELAHREATSRLELDEHGPEARAASREGADQLQEVARFRERAAVHLDARPEQERAAREQQGCPAAPGRRQHLLHELVRARPVAESIGGHGHVEERLGVAGLGQPRADRRDRLRGALALEAGIEEHRQRRGLRLGQLAPRLVGSPEVHEAAGRQGSRRRGGRSTGRDHVEGDAPRLLPLAQEVLGRGPGELIFRLLQSGLPHRLQHGGVAQLRGAAELPETHPRVAQALHQLPHARCVAETHELVSPLVEEFHQRLDRPELPMEPKRLQGGLGFFAHRQTLREVFAALGGTGGPPGEEEVADLVVDLEIVAGHEQPPGDHRLELGEGRERGQRFDHRRREGDVEARQHGEELLGRRTEGLQDACPRERHPFGARGEELLEQPRRARGRVHRRLEVRCASLRLQRSRHLRQGAMAQALQLEHLALAGERGGSSPGGGDEAGSARVGPELAEELAHLLAVGVLEVVEDHPEGSFFGEIQRERGELFRIAAQPGDVDRVLHARGPREEVGQGQPDLVRRLVGRDGQVEGPLPLFGKRGLQRA